MPLPGRPEREMIGSVMSRWRRTLVLGLAAGCAAAFGARQSPVGRAVDPAAVEARAISYLTREVPAWRREHPCYSCHNNGDAVRALVAARRGPAVRVALDDTLGWLADPARWATNGGGEGGADDKVLARIQFAHATTAAYGAALVPKAAVERAAAIVAADQQQDGSWRLDASESLGSPATYGTALATVAARRTLLASGLPMVEPIARAEGWLSRQAIGNTPDAAAILLAFAQHTTPPANWQAALEILRKGQGRDGGWGPYVTSPPEAFDTALGVLALDSLAARPSVASPAFTSEALTAAIAGGRSYLLRQQLEDGSWNETTRPAGQASYAQRISTTGWALLALIESRK